MDNNAYGLPSPDIFRIDDLLDFSNDDQIFSSSSSSSASSSSFPQETPFIPNFTSASFYPSNSFPADFSHHDLCVPSDDVAQLEWLSQFVDDSFTDVPPDPFGANFNSIPSSTSSFPGKPRSKRSSRSSWTPASSAELSDSPANGKSTMRQKKQQQHTVGDAVETGGGRRRCTHCLSETTPQWRTGPMGPKTLCNACGVRYKSGRLVPEYRPAASPTFVLTQHSNSHRKVMELRRQKEMMRQQQLQHMHHHQQQQQQSNYQSV